MTLTRLAAGARRVRDRLPTWDDAVGKMATTLDVISGGRAVFGLGAAWFEAEHEGYGFAFPPIRERMDRLDEVLTIVRAMFASSTLPARYPARYPASCSLNRSPRTFF